MVPSAYLRVFQPLDAFEREEQLRWERYLVSNRWLPGRPRRYLDHAKDGLGLIASADGEHAEVRVVDGRTYVSPWRMRMRVLAAALAFRETRPIELSDRFLSKKDAKRVARELHRLRRRDPSRWPSVTRARGTCRSGGSRSSPTRSAGWGKTSTAGSGCAIARRRAGRSVARARRSRSCDSRTSGRSATS